VISCRESDFGDAIGKFETAINKLALVCTVPGRKSRASEDTYKFCIHSSTKYLMFNNHRAVDAVPVDETLCPASLLSQVLAAKAEAVFMHSDLPGASSIQAGNALPNSTSGGSSETSVLGNELASAFSSLLDSHPNLRPALAQEDLSRSVVATKGKPKAAVVAADKDITLTTSIVPQGVPGADSSADLIRAQQVMGPFRRLLGACGDTAESAAVLSEVTAAAKPPNKTAARISKKDSGEFVLSRTSSAEILLQANESSVTKLPNFARGIDGIPQGSNSVRAEMLVVSEQVAVTAGLDSDVSQLLAKGGGTKVVKKGDPKAEEQTAKLVELALMSCEGAGLGPLGLSMVALPKLEFSERRRDKERDRIRSEAKSCQARIVDSEVTGKNINTSLKMSVFFSLAKMCMHQGLRTEAFGYIQHCESLAEATGQLRQIALAKKFRCDYEEWHGEAMQPSTAPSQNKLKRLQTLLRTIKQYYKAAIKCRDMNLYRDACKKMVNIFIEISCTPDPLGTPPRDFGTADDLAIIPPSQIDLNEESDMLWMKQFSKARAQHFMKIMKNAGKGELESIPQSAAPSRSMTRSLDRAETGESYS
jgi:hypothetical protein